MAPKAAPMASHLAARAARRRKLPPLAARTASSRSRVRTAVLARSSVRSPWEAASLTWQALQSRAKSYSGFRSSAGRIAGGAAALFAGLARGCVGSKPSGPQASPVADLGEPELQSGFCGLLVGFAASSVIGTG